MHPEATYSQAGKPASEAAIFAYAIQLGAPGAWTWTWAFTKCGLRGGQEVRSPRAQEVQSPRGKGKCSLREGKGSAVSEREREVRSPRGKGKCGLRGGQEVRSTRKKKSRSWAVALAVHWMK
jgi:hypothetical protein